MKRAVVVYESMYGNTRRIAAAIARGLRENIDEVVVVPVADAGVDVVERADLLVVGGPTHAHGMSRRNTRQAAISDAQKSRGRLTLDPAATGPGVRDWLTALPTIVAATAAAFDTRFRGPAVVTGQASRGIARGLRARGYRVVTKPESFLVEKGNRLVADEEARAESWGRELAEE